MAQWCAGADQLPQAPGAVFTSFSFLSFVGRSWHSSRSGWVWLLICLTLSAFLGKLCLLSCGQLYISPGLAPGSEVWNTVFMLVSSFLPLLRHAISLPRNKVKALVGERLATKPNKEGNQFWICCSCCHEFTRGFFCYLGSRSVWVKLPVPLHHKSLCQPVNQTLTIKMGQLNCWVACFGWLGWTALF